MPAPASANEFLDLLRESRLVEPRTLAERLDGLPAEPRAIAERLREEGLLTGLQAVQLLLGHARGFTIGKYRVLEQIGSGSGGAVFLCEQPGMGRLVAVKVLPFAADPGTSTVARFRREARALASIDHANVVHVHDFDEDDGRLFLVMEYVDGVSLRQHVKAVGRLDALRAAHYVRQAARGLQAIHEAGLVHRDLKPGNMMLDQRGCVKILDLGLARFLDDEAESLTVRFDGHRILGTPEYLSPEQARDSHEVDIRSDVYSLGATFYFCLTGQPPFPEGSVSEKLLRLQSSRPRPVAELAPDAPPPLVAIVERMMAHDPADRFQQPIEVVNALTPWTQSPVDPPRFDAPAPRQPRSRQLPPPRPVERDTDRTATPPVRPSTHVGVRRPTAPVLEPPAAKAAPVAAPPERPRPAESKLWQVVLVLATLLLSAGVGVALIWLLGAGGF